MKKEIKIVIGISEEEAEKLDQIRWNHIDINSIIEEEMSLMLPEIIENTLSLVDMK